MMKILITPTEAAAAAFAGDYISEGSITEADIAAAAEKWIVPVVGRPLYVAMTEGRYTELRDDYAVHTLALFTRVLIQPRLDVCAGPAGTVAMKSASYSPASDAQTARTRRSLLTEARMLLRRMSDYLDNNVSDFPEYDPAENILGKCSIIGHMVQGR